MPRQEGKTDIFVNDLLRKSGIRSLPAGVLVTL